MLADDAVTLRRAAQIVLARAPRGSWMARYLAGFLRRYADKLEEMSRG